MPEKKEDVISLVREDIVKEMDKREKMKKLKEKLKKGLLPDDNEIEILKEAYGNEWYKKFGLKNNMKK